MKPLITYIRNKRKGSPEPCSRQKRKLSDLSIMNSLSIQNGEQNGDQLTEVPSLCSSNNMCQIEATAGDVASFTVVENMTSEKAINGYHDCENAAGNNVVKANENIVSSDSAIDNTEENVKMACSQDNPNSEVVQRPHNLNDVTAQVRDEDMKLSLTSAPTESSRRKLLVLDVNGLLADIVSSAYVSDRYQPDTTISGKAVFKRPFCDEFLEFCFRRFNVGVWSSRIKRNVNSAVDFLMGKEKKQLLFCWDQSHCTATDFTTVENNSKPLVLKELKKLWEKSEQDLPWGAGEYNASNTLLLDDSPYKALGNPPNTAIFPHTYQYTAEKDNSLGPGGSLYVYLEGLAEAADVQMYVKEHPFGQRPITKENSSWDFYLKVMESLTSIPSQSQKCLKSENVVSKADLTSSTTKPEQFVVDTSKNKEFAMVGSSHEVRETTNSVRDVEGDSTRGSLGKEDLKRASATLEADEGGWVVKEKTVVRGSGDSPSGIWRGRKRGRSPGGGQSPVRGGSPNRSWYPRDRSPWIGRERHNISHSMSHERYGSRSKSPSYRHGGEFGGDRMRRYKAPPEECRDFMRGKCHRGATCWYLHHESDMTNQCKQQYQNVPSSSNTSDVNGKIETSPHERSGHEHSGRKIRDLDQDGLVMEERNGITEGVCTFTNQVPHKMRRTEDFREECRDFNRGKCHRGASCRHLHGAFREECRDFNRGKCQRGASCPYVHNEYDKIDGSRHSWSKQPYQDVPPIPKVCDVYWGRGTNTVPPERSVPVHNEYNPHDLRQEIPVIRKSGMKEELKRCTPPQFNVATRMDRPSRPKCHHFMRGTCSYGERCWYSHDESDKTDDRARAYRSKEQYQNVPFRSKSCGISGEIETMHAEKNQDLKQHIPIMEEKEVIKEEISKSSTQLCDGETHPKPRADAEEEKVPNDVAPPVEISATEQTPS